MVKLADDVVVEAANPGTDEAVVILDSGASNLAAEHTPESVTTAVELISQLTELGVDAPVDLVIDATDAMRLANHELQILDAVIDYETPRGEVNLSSSGRLGKTLGMLTLTASAVLPTVGCGLAPDRGGSFTGRFTEDTLEQLHDGLNSAYREPFEALVEDHTELRTQMKGLRETIRDKETSAEDREAARERLSALADAEPDLVQAKKEAYELLQAETSKFLSLAHRLKTEDAGVALAEAEALIRENQAARSGPLGFLHGIGADDPTHDANRANTAMLEAQAETVEAQAEAARAQAEHAQNAADAAAPARWYNPFSW